MNKSRFKNIYFWLGLAGVFATAIGLDFNTLTSWEAVNEALLSYISNPSLIISSLLAIIGVIVDPNTKGIRD